MGSCWWSNNNGRDGRALGARVGFLMDGEGGKARREEKGLTVPERASPQLGWSVRMGGGWGRARIGASPYDHVPCGGGFVERACRVVGYYIDSVIG